MKTRTGILIALVFVLIHTCAFSQTIIPSYVPTNSLVGWWPFNGNANDLSGNNNNGAVTGASLTTDRFGNNNSAYNFNVNNWQWASNGDYIYIPYSPIFNFSVFTISTWVNRASSGSTLSPQALAIIKRFQYGYSNPSGESWFLNIGHGTSSSGPVVTGVVIQQSPSPAPNFYCTTTQSVQANKWTNIIMRYSSNAINIYMDGSLVCSTTNTNIVLNTTGSSGISVGMSLQANGNWSPFDGKIDDVGIWGRALTECEIKKLYHSPSFTAGANQATICPGQSVTLFSGGAPNYSWSNGANTASTIVTPSATTVYTVNSTYANGCTDTKTVSVVVNPCTSINEFQSAIQLSIQPNPNNGEFTIQSETEMQINIIDQLGRKVTELSAKPGNNSYSLQHLAKGVYLLSGKANGKAYKGKVVVN